MKLNHIGVPFPVRKFPLFLSFFFIAACNHPMDHPTGQAADRRPIITSAYGVHVDKDSIPTEIIVAGKPKKVAAGKPTTIAANANVHMLPPEIPSHELLPENVTVQIPGTGHFSQPKEYAVQQKRVRAGPPDVVVAKSMISKDLNPGNFSFFRITQGIPANVIRDIAEDQFGFLWIGTTLGLSRYDGKYFSTFTSSSGLRSDDILTVCPDSSGNLWLGTYNGELMKYDGRYFTWYDLPDTTLGFAYINKIITDTKGNIWIVRGNAVIKFNGERFTILSAENGLPGTRIYDALEDHEGNMWFATDRGLSGYDGSRFINFTTHATEENECECDEWENTQALLLDHANNLWACGPRSLTCYSGHSLISGKGKYVRFTEEDGLPQHMIALHESRDHRLWIGTRRSGVVKYDGSSFSILDAESGLCAGLVRDMFEDKSGNFWIGTNNGLARYDGDIFRHYTENEGVAASSVYNVFRDSKGKIWIATFENGISCFDGKNFTNYSSISGLPANEIASFSEDSKGNIWMATWANGICKFDGSSFTNYTKREGLASDTLYKLAVDGQDNIWICTVNGLCKMDSGGSTFTHYKIGSKSTHIVREIFIDDDQTIWVGTEDAGIYSLDSTGFTHFNPDHGFPRKVYSVIKDRNDFLWFCSGYPVSILSCYDGKRTININLSDLGFSTAWAIAEDQQGDLWLGTNGTGVVKLSHKNFESYYKKLVDSYSSNESASHLDYNYLFRNYDEEDGFLGINVWTNSFCRAPDGRLWWGSTDRVTTFDPSVVRADTIGLSMQIHGVKLFSETIDWAAVKSGDKKVLNNGVRLGNIKFDSTSYYYNLPLNLSLPYDNNNVALEFIGINLKSRNKIQYQYQLEGLEENWSALTIDNEVNYGTLQPGHYTFRVKAMNSDGYWSLPVGYSFSIRPPWWATWWFRVLMIFVFVSGTIWFIRARTSSLRRQKLVLEKTVEERTIDLQKQKEVAEEQRIRAEHSEQIKKQFLANMSHEIRTPMNAVMGMTELMLNTTVNEKQRNYLEGMKKSSHNLLHIINDILDLSKIEAGKVELEYIHFSIRDLVQHLKDILQDTARKKGLQLLTTVDPSIPEVLIGDPTRLSQVLINLSNNALKFTEKGSVWIELAREEDKAIKFSVIDTGIGIPAEKLDSIFESFSQAHVSDSRKYGGTGLGLTISKQYIELMGGMLQVESVENRGSTFSFELHLKEGSMEKLLMQSRPEETNGNALQGLKILLVDDSPDNRIVARDLLISKAKVIIEEATNGREAISMLSQQDYDIVLMDVQMPLMDGYQATREIRDPDSTVRNHSIPVIALTASVIRSDLDKCMTAGMNDYVPKPFRVSQLISTIARLSGRV